MTPDPLSEVERTAAWEERFAAVRHDLRERLAMIRAAAFYLQRASSQPAAWESDLQVSRYFAIIDEEIGAAHLALETELELEDPLRRDTAPVHVVACVRQALASVRVVPAVGVELTIGNGAEAHCVHADPREVAVALRCLVENALEASTPPDPVCVTVAVRGDHAVVTVIDRGVGIPDHQRSLVRKRFYTTKRGHAGLGLTIADRLATRNGGTLSIEPPDPARPGTRAWLALPLSPSEG